MNRKLLHKLMGICFLILLSVCSFEWNSREVMAAEVDFSTKYVDEEGKYISKEIAVSDKQNLVTIDGEDWVFAGWYKAKECTYQNAYTTTPKETAYAKYVPAEVLSVKCQVTPNAGSKKTAGEKVNMRMLSTIESLNYSDIGFEVSFNGGKFIKCSGNKKVYKRIESCSEANVDYTFSPKLFDTKSEYFITHTLTGIGPNSQDGTFLIRPYWKTLDGTTVYGQNRTVKVSDSYSDIVSLNVKSTEYVEGLTVSSADASVELGSVEKHYSQNENYATLRVKVTTDTSNMKSVTEFKVMNGEMEVTKGTHRNTYTEYTKASQTIDTSWYDVYGKDAEEYVIATTADLYGFANIVNRASNADTFSGQKIYLVSDIKVNDMTVAEMQAVLGTTETADDPLLWSSIGYDQSTTKDADITKYFGGIFDGQEHVVKGICTKQYGMFGWAYGATIQNFSLIDSYMVTNNNAGSIVNTFDGTLDTVYSNMTIHSTNNVVGGLIARTTNGTKTGAIESSKFTVTNCWYDGDITQEHSSNNTYCGGLVGFVIQGTATNSHVVQHSLHTGTIVIKNTNSSYKVRAGGIVGALNATTLPLVLEDCLAAGEFSVTTDSNAGLQVGSIVGRNGSVTKITNDTYVYTTSTWNNQSILGVTTTTNANIIIQKSDCKNYKSYNTMQKLMYYKGTQPDGYWVVRDNDVPALKSFVDEWIDVAWYYDNKDKGADTFTISTKEQLYGLSAISQDDAFSEKTIQLGDDIKVNTKTIDKDVYTEEEWGNFIAELRPWKSIGNESTRFAGNFDGKRHTISGLYQHATVDYAGLFASTDAGSVVRDLKLTNSYFASEANFMGSIAGQGAGTFDTIYSNAIVESSGTQIGGLIGRVNKVESSQHVINNCWFDGNVTLTYDTDAKVYGGAIVGAFVQGTLDITNCLNTGNVTHISTTDATKNKNYFVGAFCGAPVSNNTSPALTISNCINAGEIKDTLADGTKTTYNIVSAAVGCANNGTTTLQGFFSISECCDYVIRGGSGSISWKGNLSLSESQFTGKSSYINAIDNKNNRLNFCTRSNPTGVWVVTENGIPALKSFTDEWIDVAWYYDIEDYEGGNNEYELSTPEEFYGFSAISQDYTFENDIVKLCEDVVLDKMPGREWTPIGTSNVRFMGTFDGGNHVIRGVHVKANDSSQYVGLFGYTRNNIIKNFTLKDSTYTGDAMGIGCVVGSGEGDLSGIYCDNSVSISSSSARFIGGIIGHIQDSERKTTAERLEDTNCTIKNCWFAGTIKQSTTGASSTDAAGFVGFAANGNIIIDNCLYTGAVTVEYKGTSTKASYASGFCGHHTGYTSNQTYSSLIISNCLSAGSINRASYSNGYAGAILGKYGDKETYTSVYATTECCTSAVGTGTSTQPIIPVGEEELYNTIKELESNYWVARNADIPVLKSLNNSSEIEVGKAWLYESVGNERDPYVISQTTELEGLGTLVNTGTTFEGEFISLVEDIQVYDGDAKKWAKGESLPSGSWMPIGYGDNKTAYTFKGTFDGHNHTIRGLYVKQNNQVGVGLFGNVNGATIRNLRIKNSYFEANSSTGAHTGLGSFVGFGGGHLSNLYSDAIIKSSYIQIGGIIGRVQYGSVLKNCWYAGEIDANYKGTSQYLTSGGLIGGIINGQAVTTVDTCLYTGNINFSAVHTGTKTTFNARVGGLVGADNAGNGWANIQNSFSAGTIYGTLKSTDNQKATSMGQIGGLMGYTNNTSASFANTYATTTMKITIEATDKVSTVTNNFGKLDKTPAINTTARFDTENMLGFGSRLLTNLSFTSKEATNYWSARLGQIPVPYTMNDIVSDELEIGDIGRANTDWYSQDNIDQIDGAYVIDSIEDLYGFAMLSQTETFAGETIKLGADIHVNDSTRVHNSVKQLLKTEDDWNASKWTSKKISAALPWYKISLASEVKDKDENDSNNIVKVTSNRFEGTFDGKNHTISGLYMSQSSTNMGLFAATEYGSAICNLRLRNSYFNQKENSCLGSIVADCRGSLENIYSDAILSSTYNQVGGIVARANGYNCYTMQRTNDMHLNNCWYAGTITSSAKQVGGMIGTVIQGEWKNENCVFTGTIISSYSDSASIGGMIGEILAPSLVTSTLNGVTVQTTGETRVELNACISTGTIKTTNKDIGAGSVVGVMNADVVNSTYEEKNTYLIMKNVFASYDSGYIDVYGKPEDTLTDSAGIKHTAAAIVTGSSVRTNSADRLVGYCEEENVGGYEGGELIFGEDAWTVRNEGVPVPSTFRDIADVVTRVANVDDILCLKSMDDSWTTASATNYGLGHYVLKTTGKTFTDFKNYLTTLKAKGFVPAYANNDLDETITDGAYSVIYKMIEGEWILNILYSAHSESGEVTLTISNGLNSLSPDLEKRTGTERSVTMSMVKLTGSPDDLGGEYGNSFIFKLPTGHFVINDGGTTKDFEGLIAQLKSMANIPSDDTTTPIYIDAWTVTHQHGDHFNVIRGFSDDKNAKAREQVYVKAFYINEPNRKAMSVCLDEEDVYNDKVIYQNRAIRLLKADEAGNSPKVYWCQTGQTYYFDGLTMDVVQSQEQIPVESYGKRNAGDDDGTDYNTTSTSMLFATETGKKVLITGDMNYVNMRKIMQIYGNKPSLLSGLNIYQAPHHGKNTSINIHHFASGNNNEFTDYLINLIDPETDTNKEQFDVTLFPYSMIYGVDNTDWISFPNAKSANNYLKGKSQYCYHYGDGTKTFLIGNQIELQQSE